MTGDRQRVAAVVLAAGASSRFGRPKQLAEHEGLSLVRRAATAAIDAGASPVFVVLGAHAELVSRSLAGLDDVHIVVNEQWASGLASSLARGIGALSSESDSDGVLITLADQPSVDAAALSKLLDAFDVEHRLVVSEYEDAFGVPAVIGREHFGDLARLQGDRGAGPWLRDRESQVTKIPLPAAALDIDTADDAERLH